MKYRIRPVSFHILIAYASYSLYNFSLNTTYPLQFMATSNKQVNNDDNDSSNNIDNNSYSNNDSNFME
jgi:hypothetical protein